jgi:hypothetical protein
MAKLTAAIRNKLPSTAFAEPGARKFPIPDASHARNALARASGTPSAGAVKAKVRVRFPGIEVKKP